MNILSLIAAVIIPTLNGFLACAWFLRNDAESSLLERVSLGFGLGLGFLTFEIFILGVLEVSLALWVITLIQVVFFVSLLLNYWLVGGLTGEAIFGSRPDVLEAKEAAPSEGGRFSGLKPYIAVILIAWIAIKALFVIDECLARPIFSIDAWGHWASGAKFFFYERGFNLNPADWNFFGRGYRVDLGYPLHLSLIELWAALWLGNFNEALVKIWSALYFLALGAFFFCAVKREIGRFMGLVWVFFFVSAPLMVYHGIEGLADLPLAFYAFTSVVFFWRYLKRLDLRLLGLSGLLVGMAICTKYEGVFFFFALLLALAVKLIARRRTILVSVAVFLLPVLIIVGPWLLFKRLNDLGMLHKGIGSQITSVVKHVPRGVEPETKKALKPAKKPEKPVVHWKILDDIFIKLFLSANYNIIIAFWIVFSLASCRKIWKTELKYIHLIVFAVFFLFVALYLIFVPDVVKEETAIYRNALTYMPILYFSSALLSARLREP